MPDVLPINPFFLRSLRCYPFRPILFPNQNQRKTTQAPVQIRCNWDSVPMSCFKQSGSSPQLISGQGSGFRGQPKGDSWWWVDSLFTRSHRLLFVCIRMHSWLNPVRPHLRRSLCPSASICGKTSGFRPTQKPTLLSLPEHTPP
jgi:hypothetical protein